MNEYMEIKELLAKYYEVKSTEADEQRLREYFTSGSVAAELQPYRSIFGYLQHEREHPSEEAAIVALPVAQPRRIRWWYAAAAVAACLFGATFLVHKLQPMTKASCTGTYVVVNGVCYDDMTQLKRHAVEAIDLITQPFENGYLIDDMECLNDER
jgi:hypothetical protein